MHAASAFGAPPVNTAPTAGLPTTPSTPVQLGQKTVKPLFVGCHRDYIYREKTYDCDSTVRQDGENMRHILTLVPAAEVLLDEYQHTNRSIKKLAYVGTAGLVVALAGFIVSTRYYTPDGKDSGTSRLIRTASVISGLTLTVGSFVTGFTIAQTNERRLIEAVDLYNKERPKDPISLQFSTSLIF